MKLWQCQMESDQDAGEAGEAEEEVETEESREDSGAENYEGGTDEEGGGEDESEEDGETEENADEEEEEEDAETFGYEKIEKSEVEQLDCSSMGNRWGSTTSINLNQGKD